MDKGSALYQLMDIRINDALDKIIQADEEYQQIILKSREYLDKLETLHLPHETWLLIDRYISEQNALSSRYGMLAYLLGFSDCTNLICATSHFHS